MSGVIYGCFKGPDGLDYEQDRYDSRFFLGAHGVVALYRFDIDHCRHSGYVATFLDIFGLYGAVGTHARTDGPCLLPHFPSLGVSSIAYGCDQVLDGMETLISP